MMDVCVILGSKSDLPKLQGVLDHLPKHEVFVASAHRSPDLVAKIVKETKAKCFLCAAGLAAHLPGVVASKTLKPVFGVPMEGNYEGLDALLSITQMPPGIPVIGCGVNGGSDLKKFASIAYEFSQINLTGDLSSKAADKCRKMLEQFDLEFTEESRLMDEALNINFVRLLDEFEIKDKFAINVPVMDDSKALQALEHMAQTKTGFWVGLNRGDNAALAGLEILNYNGSFQEKLSEYREEQRKAVPGKIS